MSLMRSLDQASLVHDVASGVGVEANGLPTLVLLPGLDGTGKLFSEFIKVLGTGIDVQVITYPTDQPLGYEELELRVRAALPSHGRFVLLGESFSGPIAIRIAATAPPGLSAVILCGSFAKNPYPLLGWAHPLAAFVPLKSLPRWVRAPLMWGSRRTSQVPVRSERALAAVSSGVVRRRIAALLTVDATDALVRISLPMLVLFARNDRVVPKAATQWLLARSHNALSVAIDGPHLLLQTRPHECAAPVVRFLRTVINEDCASAVGTD
jgi:pimeloyl-ACP methyl ester carboxylesterase